MLWREQKRRKRKKKKKEKEEKEEGEVDEKKKKEKEIKTTLFHDHFSLMRIVLFSANESELWSLPHLIPLNLDKIMQKVLFSGVF